MSISKKQIIKSTPLIIITGGSGYIGIHITYTLFKLKNYRILILDKKPHNFFIKKKIAFLKVDLSNKKKVNKILKKFKPFLIIHLSGMAHITESFKKEKIYKKNNEAVSFNLLNAMKNNGCKNIIFSSSCLVYGNKTNQKENIKNVNGLSPYAKNKIYVEKKIISFSKKYDFNYCIIRFFNAAGVLGGSNRIGYTKKSGLRIIPLILRAIYRNRILYLNGNDHNTYDGTCIRDFIHPLDIAIFIKRIIKNFEKRMFKEIINLGSGNGYSINQLINLCLKKLNKNKIKVNIKKRRKGDSPILIANISKANNEFNLKLRNSNINKIILSTYEWIKKN